MGGKDKCFKEPSCMGEMPLGRTGIGTGLHHLVFGAQSGRQGFGLPSTGAITICQRGPCRFGSRRCAKTQNRLEMGHESFPATINDGQPEGAILLSATENCTTLLHLEMPSNIRCPAPPWRRFLISS